MDEEMDEYWRAEDWARIGTKELDDGDLGLIDDIPIRAFERLFPNYMEKEKTAGVAQALKDYLVAREQLGKALGKALESAERPMKMNAWSIAASALRVLREPYHGKSSLFRSLVRFLNHHPKLKLYEELKSALGPSQE